MQKAHIGLFLIVLMTVSVVAPLAATRAQALEICSTSMSVVPTRQPAPFDQPDSYYPPRITSVQAGSSFYVWCYWWDNNNCQHAEGATIHIQYWDDASQTWVTCGVGVTGTGGVASGKVNILCTAPALSGDVKFRAQEDNHGTVEHPFILTLWPLPTGPGATSTVLFLAGHTYINTDGTITVYADQGETYSISGFVVDPDGNWGGGAVEIQLYRQLPGQSSLTPWKNVTTDANGVFATTDTQSAPGNVIYQAQYPGDNSRQPSSDTQAIFLRYRTTLSLNEYGGFIWRNFFGYLRDQTRRPVPGVYIIVQKNNGASWYILANPKTNKYGEWTASDVSMWGHAYRAEYGGNGTLSGSISREVLVNIFQYSGASGYY